jgi:hypothetical protein
MVTAILDGASDKIGDAHAFGPGKFLVVERDSALGSSSLKKIFEINLAGATDISTLSPAIAGPGGTLDKMCVAFSSAARTAASSSKATASPALIRLVPVTSQPSARNLSARRVAV